ncbi:MAG: ANTAR domain-containing protein [Jatrophihabitans sp.]
MIALDLPSARLVLSQIDLGRTSLPEVLAQVARLAYQSIPEGAGGVSVRLVEADRADLLEVVGEPVGELERLQHQLAEGPTVQAAATWLPVESGSLGGDPRWLHFGPRAGRAGVHSVLVLPLLTEHPLGLLTLYTQAKNAFLGSIDQTWQAFAAASAAVLGNAHALARAHRLVAGAHWSATDGAVVQRAVGILMGRRGIGADEALATLRELSQHQNVKLVALASQLVDEAVRRARGRTAAG